MLVERVWFTIEPGRGTEWVRFAQVSGVSVWPKPSKMVRPVLAFQKSKRSGLSASPAVVEYSSEERSKRSKSSCIIRRYIVGGQHSVVIWYLSMRSRISAGWKRSKSYVKTHASMIH